MTLSLPAFFLVIGLTVHPLALAAVLLTRREEANHHSWFMVVLLVPIALGNLATIISPDLAHPEGVQVAIIALLIFATTATRFLVAPSVYFFVRALAMPASGSLPYLGGYKIPLATGAIAGILETSIFVYVNRFGVASGAATLVIAIYVLFWVMATAYVFGAMAIMVRKQLPIRQAIAGNTVFAWAYLVLLGLLVLAGWATTLWMDFADLTAEPSSVLPDWVGPAVLIAWVYPTSLMAFVRRRHNPRAAPVDGSADDTFAVPSADGAATTAIKYARSRLDDQRASRMARKLNHVIATNRPYLNPQVTLRDLADQTGISPAYLSQVLNDRFGLTFFDFINQWRVEAACGMLRETDKSIAEVWEASGFNSRSTFNAAFRKKMGIRPRDYRKAAPGDNSKAQGEDDDDSVGSITAAVEVPVL